MRGRQGDGFAQQTGCPSGRYGRRARYRPSSTDSVALVSLGDHRHHQQVDERTTYVVEKEITARDEAAKACAAVLEVLGPTLRCAAVDAYSDYNDQMPPDVAEAGRWLQQRGLDRHAGDPGMGVEVQVSDDGWEVACRYAPWSIHVELFGDGPSPIGTLHDCGFTITADLSPAEAAALASRLAGISGLIPLHELQERRRQARRDKVWRLLGRRRPDA